MKRSPLHEIHQILGAHFIENSGWEMPAHYGNPAAEHLHVRKGVGIADLSHRGKIRITGKDRGAYLQRLLSQDMNRLTPFSGAYATLLDVKGRTLAYMRIYCNDDSFLIDIDPGLSENTVKLLTHYLFREDVSVEDLTERFGLVALQGPLSGELLKNVTGTDFKDMEECGHLNICIHDVSCKVVRTSYTGAEGYDIYAPWDATPSVWEGIVGDTSHISLRNMGSVPIPFGPIPFGIDALETLRIEAGTPVYSVDIDEHTIPVEADLDRAISYDKGCYIGQETIARIKFRGHINRTFTGFYINEAVVPEKGDKIFKVTDDIEQSIGVITSGCLSPFFNKPIALGYIRIEYNKPGEIVYIERGLQRLTAIVAQLPFYDSSYR